MILRKLIERFIMPSSFDLRVNPKLKTAYKLHINRYGNSFLALRAVSGNVRTMHVAVSLNATLVERRALCCARRHYFCAGLCELWSTALTAAS